MQGIYNYMPETIIIIIIIIIISQRHIYLKS